MRLPTLLGPRPVTELRLILDHQMLDFRRLIHSHTRSPVRPPILLPSHHQSPVATQMEFLPGFVKTHDRS
jgi:hypothetical protein